MRILQEQETTFRAHLDSISQLGPVIRPVPLDNHPEYKLEPSRWTVAQSVG